MGDFFDPEPVIHPTSPKQRPKFGWASLTGAELRVARLVSEGLTNRAAARALTVSHHTVDAHLRHIFAKLSISSRVALTRLVVINDLDPLTDREAA